MHVRVAPLPAVFSIDEALERRARDLGRDNVFKSYTVSRGDVDGGVRRARR